MSGVAWRPLRSQPAAARLPWLRPPRAASARHLIHAVLNTRTGTSTCTPAAAESRCVIVRGPGAAAETVALREPLRLAAEGESAARSRSAWQSSGGSSTAAPVSTGAGPAQTLGLRARLLAVLQPPLEASLSRSGPLEWPADLLDYQLTGIRLLLDRDRLLLADEMGLGEDDRGHRGHPSAGAPWGISSCLVIVPAAVFYVLDAPT